MIGMKILIDCDVLLDVAMKREPFYPPSALICNWAESHPGRAGVAWHSLSILAYLSEKDPRPFLADLLTFMRVAQVGHEHAEKALRFPMRDFEDALQTAAATAFGAAYIVTRNEKDFRASPVPCLSPKAFIQSFAL